MAHPRASRRVSAVSDAFRPPMWSSLRSACSPTRMFVLGLLLLTCGRLLGCQTSADKPDARTIEARELVVGGSGAPSRPVVDQARAARAAVQADAVARAEAERVAADGAAAADEASGSEDGPDGGSIAVGDPDGSVADGADATDEPITGEPDLQPPLTEREFVFRELAPGERWPVESLVGQVNGRPIFVDEFLVPIEDRLRAIVAANPPEVAREQIIQLVSQRFNDTVNNQLVISEAESQLSPEEQFGLFAWLASQREQETARRGGSQYAANASLQEELGVGLDEFLEERRNFALAARLIDQRITPRTIVSWRDIEFEFERNRLEFAPPGSAIVGRIRFRTDREADQIAAVTDAFARGATFAEVAEDLELPDGGAWREFAFAEDGSGRLPALPDEIEDAMADLEPGEATDAIIVGSSTAWFAILEIDRPEPRTLWDPEVQLALRQKLEQQRKFNEQNRYLNSLRSRWVSSELERMKIRVIAIALRRSLG